MKETGAVWAIGDNTIDRYVRSGTDLVGGNAANVAVQLARLGLEVRYAGAVGEDPEGMTIREALVRQAVDVDALIVAPGTSAVTTIRITEQGDRVFESEDFGVTASYFPAPEVIARAAQASWVHIGMLPRADELRRELRAAGVRVSQDMAVSGGIENLDVAFFSLAGREADAPDTALTAIRAGVSCAVVTLGAAGAYAMDASGREYRQAAIPTDVVDTTGAGDAFIAGFISSAVLRHDVEDALLRGAEVAAQACRHPGGWPQ